MKAVSLTAILAVACMLIAGLPAGAQQEKEVTLKGTLLCAKCVLKETKECQSAIRVKEKDKDVVYYFKDKGASETYHEPICGGDRKEGSVTGLVATKDGKKWITPKKVEFDKKDEKKGR